jgi:hypothetical protein
MSKTRIYVFLTALSLSVIGLEASFASFSISGIVDEKNKNNKYSLSSLGNYSKRGLSLNAIKADLQYKGLKTSTPLMATGGTVMGNLQFGQGNTVYVYPYKIKVKVPKFKTPVQPQ